MSRDEKSVNRRLAAYSAVAAAGACSVGITSDADAAIVYSGALNYSVAATTLGSYFNTTTFAFGASYSAVNGGDTTAPAVNLWGTSNTFTYFYPSTSTVNRFASSNGTLVAKLTGGAAIDASTTYTATRSPGAITAAGGNWATGDTGYLGLKFLSGGQTLYGWIQITAVAPPTAANPIKILGAAYETSGAGILAGATGSIPEPGSAGLLALGSTGALAWRRRKAA